MAPVISVSSVGIAFLAAVAAQSWRSAIIQLNGTSTHEMLRLIDQIDRNDLSDTLAVAPTMA